MDINNSITFIHSYDVGGKYGSCMEMEMMNERIRELAEQAGIAVWGDAVYMYDPKDTLDSTVMAKFAELIVKECAGIGDNYQEILGNEPECFNCRKVAYGIVDKIKQHFGVEE